MKRSWSNSCIDGYEIKVSRSDFLKDEKWQGYLGLCNRFWFVCPAKLIAAEELPQEVGLIWVASTGNSLFTKRKAIRRQVDIPDSLWRYIVMCRTKIAFTYPSSPEDNLPYFQKWLAEKKEGRWVGSRVAKALQKRVEAAEEKSGKLTGLMKQYDDIRSLITQLNLNPDNPWDLPLVKGKIERVREIVPPHLADSLRRMATQAVAVADKLDKATQETPDNQEI